MFDYQLPRLLSKADVCNRLKISIRTVENMVLRPSKFRVRRTLNIPVSFGAIAKTLPEVAWVTGAEK
jgi:hypothetical protein